MLEHAMDPAKASALRAFLTAEQLSALLAASEQLTVEGHGSLVTYSRKVFIPLTKLCRDVCHYCTFAATPRRVTSPYLTRDEVLVIARAGQAAGCREALFTLGDRPEARYREAREALALLGHDTTLGYLREMAEAVSEETGLLPHLNPGLMDHADLAMLRPVSASMGIMLETTAERLSMPGGPHHGSPDKLPQRRIATIAAAGEARVPFTTGLLIGIGETRDERLDALFAIDALHRRYGHIQEVIIQNFRAKPGTRMATYPSPTLEDHLWTIAAARLILGSSMSIQAPPNLQPGQLAHLLQAGVNDWGGVSPVTADHVNPEAPWPHLDTLEEETCAAGRVLRERLAVGPAFAQAPDLWLAPTLATRVRRSVDGRGLPVTDGWHAGSGVPVPFVAKGRRTVGFPTIDSILDRGCQGGRLDESDIVRLFSAEGAEAGRVALAADTLRREVVGDAVTYVVNRNINYTNICLYRCGFCAFSKGSTRAMRGPAYRLDLDEVGLRAAQAQALGATEVCLQGGIHPDYDGRTYLNVIDAVKAAAPGIHIHAFSPLEISHGAATLDLSLGDFLAELKDRGLASLPGTAAEILDDEMRDILCPDKLRTAEWLEVMREAHRVGLRSTATIMFGHVDGYEHWAKHLLHIRDLQQETGGFTEFVPLSFVHMGAPIWQRGKARSGPSLREAILMHAVARIVLHPLIPNIQASWVKLGREGAISALNAGANDLGGVLMNESITRAAGGVNGQIFDEDAMKATARDAGRFASQRTTLYANIGRDRIDA